MLQLFVYLNSNFVPRWPFYFLWYVEHLRPHHNVFILPPRCSRTQSSEIPLVEEVSHRSANGKIIIFLNCSPQRRGFRPWSGILAQAFGSRLNTVTSFKGYLLRHAGFLSMFQQLWITVKGSRLSRGILLTNARNLR